jgi:hypothetical protein
MLQPEPPPESAAGGRLGRLGKLGRHKEKEPAAGDAGVNMFDGVAPRPLPAHCMRMRSTARCAAFDAFGADPKKTGADRSRRSARARRPAG